MDRFNSDDGLDPLSTFKPTQPQKKGNLLFILIYIYSFLFNNKRKSFQSS